MKKGPSKNAQPLVILSYGYCSATEAFEPLTFADHVAGLNRSFATSKTSTPCVVMPVTCP